MSEMKVYVRPLKTNILGQTIVGQSYYLESEADKVIAELKADYKEACDRLQTANLIKDEQLAATRHHKYKRCLAMARWCDSEANYWHDSSKVQQHWRYGHYIRWFNKWSKLAEKFKEAK